MTRIQTIARETLGLLVCATLTASFAANICALVDAPWLAGAALGFAATFGAVLPLLDVATDLGWVD